MKKLLSAFVILAAVSLIASPAFATTCGLQVTPFTVAAELIGCTLPTPVTLVLNSYTTLGSLGNCTNSSQISKGTVLTLTLDHGSTWTTGSQIYICDATTTTQYNSNGSVLGPGNVQTMTLTNNISPTTAYDFQNTPCTTPGFNPGAPGLIGSVNVPPNSTAGYTIDMCVTNIAPTPLNDPNINSCAPIVVLKNQFSATLIPDNTYIDFGCNMTSFVETVPKTCVAPYDTKDCAYAGLLLTSDETLGQKVSVTYPSGTPANACNGTLSTADTIVVTASGNLTGLSELDYDSFSTGIAPPGTSQVLKVPGSTVQICSGAAPDLTTCSAVQKLSLCDNNPDNYPTWPIGTEIVPGCETVSIQLTGGGGGATDLNSCYKRFLIAAGATAWCLNVNATSFYIPYLDTSTANPGVQTFCTVNNFSPAASLSSATNPTGSAAVTLDILSSEDGSGIASGLSLGTVPPNCTALITFIGDTVKMYGAGGATQTIGVTPGGAGGTRYSGRVNVESTWLGVDFQCVQTDPNEPSGEKRNVQVTTNPNFTHSVPAPLQ